MRVRFIRSASVNVGYANGVTISYSGQEGESHDFPSDIAAMFVTQGNAVAEVQPEVATKPKQQRAVRPRKEGAR